MKSKNEHTKKSRCNFTLQRNKIKKFDFSNLPLIIKGDKNE